LYHEQPTGEAITVADTWAIRDTFAALSADPEVRVVILTAEGKGFNAGSTSRRCSRSRVRAPAGSGRPATRVRPDLPHAGAVIAAVNDFCWAGRGDGGSCDILIASTRPLGLPEVDNGALGCASHLAKLVPPMKLRQMVSPASPCRASSSSSGDGVQLTEPDELMDVALDVARRMTLKKRRVIGAKQGLNDIDTFDLARNYRLDRASPTSSTPRRRLRGRDEFVAGDRS